jgi:hypothetical protein
MNMTLKDVFDVQIIGCAILHNSAIVCMRCTSRGGIIVENRIEYDRFGRGWVTDDVGHGGCPLVKESVDLSGEF